MDGLYYVLSIVAIFVIIKWVISNEAVGPGKPTTGLLAIKHHRPGGEGEIGRRRTDASC